MCKAKRFARSAADRTPTLRDALPAFSVSVAKACRKDFTITSGTLFATHIAPFRAYLAAIAVFLNEVKGKNALALSRDLGSRTRSCWVTLHKLREAMSAEFKGHKIGGPGKQRK